MLIILKGRTRMGDRASGFSLIEMIIALGLLTVVLGIAVEGISQMMNRNAAEGEKVDTVQETRDFVDQMVRDLHDVGFPAGRVMTGNPGCSGNINVSCGIVTFDSTHLQYEGDLDGSGTVSEVYMQLLVPASGNCPCTLQRGVVTKQQALGGTLPTYFTEVNGVINSGNGAGAATYPISLPVGGNYSTYGTADVFAAYDASGDPEPACIDVLSCSSILSVQITANVVPNYMDIKTRTFPVYSITSKARLNNSVPN